MCTGRYKGHKVHLMPKPEGTYSLLSTIQSPADLRQLPAGKLPELAAELREFLIQRQHPRRPLCRRLGHGRADHRPALRL